MLHAYDPGGVQLSLWTGGLAEELGPHCTITLEPRFEREQFALRHQRDLEDRTDAER